MEATKKLSPVVKHRSAQCSDQYLADLALFVLEKGYNFLLSCIP